MTDEEARMVDAFITFVMNDVIERFGRVILEPVEEMLITTATNAPDLFANILKSTGTSGIEDAAAWIKAAWIAIQTKQGKKRKKDEGNKGEV